MKKTFLLLLILFLCCNLQSVAQGYREWDCESMGHRASCTAPSVCNVCGKTVWDGITFSYIDHDFSLTMTDKHYHWTACKYCKAVDDWEGKQLHYTFCDQPGYCMDCHKNVEEDGIVIYENYIYHMMEFTGEFDKLYHYQVCTICGKTEKERHCKPCDSAEDCIVCERTIVGDGISPELVHPADYQELTPEYNQEYHWWYCRSYDMVVGKAKHRANCEDPTTCVDCGESLDNGIIISTIDHFSFPEEVHTDLAWHWWICERCGEQTDKGVHTEECTDRGKCLACGVTAASGAVMVVTNHDGTDSYHTDKNDHWFNCEACGQEYREPHNVLCYGAPGVCTICGVACNKDVMHVNNNMSDYKPYSETEHIFPCVIGHGDVTETHRFLSTGLCADCSFASVDVMMALEPLAEDLACIEEEAFAKAGLKRLRLNESVTSIGAKAFAEGELEAIYIPAGTIAIATDAFFGCKPVIYGYQGTYAEQFAQANSLVFIRVD